MEEQHRLNIFEAQTNNVKELEKAWKHINRQINTSILEKNQKGIEINTKLLALIYCALAESIFSKLIHTPHGLKLAEISQVKKASNSNGIKFGWGKCVSLAIQNVEGKKSNHVQNVQKKLDSLIDQYIFDPSLLRNKLAHGQWTIALNKDNTAVNQEISTEINNLNVVELYRRKNAFEKLAAIIEDIIESPNKAHHRDYWSHLVNLEEEQKKLASWTFEEKERGLFRKKSYKKEN